MMQCCLVAQSSKYNIYCPPKCKRLSCISLQSKTQMITKFFQLCGTKLKKKTFQYTLFLNLHWYGSFDNRFKSTATTQVIPMVSYKYIALFLNSALTAVVYFVIIEGMMCPFTVVGGLGGHPSDK